MKIVKGAVKVWLTCMIISLLLVPARSAEAAKITGARLLTSTVTLPSPPYLIGGVQYPISLDTDRAFGTKMSTTASFFAGRGLWLDATDGHLTNIVFFRLPINHRITWATIRVNAFFDPLAGTSSRDERVIGTYDIKQPADHENVTAIPNSDGTVTVSWDDNSNMEKYYVITRHGPDGSKTFYYQNTMDYIGRLAFTDKTTDKSKDTFYMYRVTAVMDEQFVTVLTAYEEEGLTKYPNLGVSVITKAPAKATESIGLIGKDHLINFTGAGSVVSQLPTDFKKPIGQAAEEKKSKDIYDAIHSEISVIGSIGGIDLTEAIKNKYSVTGITLDIQDLTLKEGESTQLMATVQPATALNKNVLWKSDNPAVATVDATGRVTAVSLGTTTIRAQTEDGGFVATNAITVVGDEPKGPDTVKMQFPDVPSSHWAADDIAHAVSGGIIYGYPDGTFGPEGYVTRAEFAVMLIRGLPPLPQVPPLAFADNAAIGQWAVEHVAQAVARGIILGYPDGTFRPDANITHAETMVMVVRASGLDTGQATQTSFADDAAIPDWAKAAVATAQAKGMIFGGILNNQFAPETNSTRAEAASSIVKMLSQ